MDKTDKIIFINNKLIQKYYRGCSQSGCQGTERRWDQMGREDTLAEWLRR